MIDWLRKKVKNVDWVSVGINIFVICMLSYYLKNLVETKKLCVECEERLMCNPVGHGYIEIPNINDLLDNLTIAYNNTNNNFLIKENPLD